MRLAPAVGPASIEVQRRELLEVTLTHRRIGALLDKFIVSAVILSLIFFDRAHAAYP
jgi:hypothetical protein